MAASEMFFTFRKYTILSNFGEIHKLSVVKKIERGLFFCLFDVMCFCWFLVVVALFLLMCSIEGFVEMKMGWIC